MKKAVYSSFCLVLLLLSGLCEAKDEPGKYAYAYLLGVFLNISLDKGSLFPGSDQFDREYIAAADFPTCSGKKTGGACPSCKNFDNSICILKDNDGLPVEGLVHLKIIFTASPQVEHYYVLSFRYEQKEKGFEWIFTGVDKYVPAATLASGQKEFFCRECESAKKSVDFMRDLLKKNFQGNNFPKKEGL